MIRHPWALLAPALLISCSNDVQLQKEANLDPTASIQFPDDLSEFTENDTIEFRGLVGDTNGIADVSTVSWTSDRDGVFNELGPGDIPEDGLVTAPTTLSQGTHTVTLQVQDAGGLTASDSISVIISAAEQLPSVDIVSPDNLSEIQVGTVVDLVGSVTDPNQTPDSLALSWTVETADGSVGPDALAALPTTSAGITEAQWTAAALDNYVIRLSATDDDGNTANAEIALIVVDAGNVDADGDNWSPNQGDCDDTDPNISPSAEELCNGIDDDCDTIVDNKDADTDGHVDEDCAGTYAGNLPADDCDDTLSTVHGGAPELADGLDNDCDGQLDEGSSTWDEDGDCVCPDPSGNCTGSNEPACVTLTGGDCDDSDPFNFPGNTEICDGYDNDCDRTVDNGLPTETWYLDLDGDGTGDDITATVTCDGSPGSGWVLAGGDCDDNDPDNFPGNTEQCDGLDNDCDNVADNDITFTTYYFDDDGDGAGDDTTATDTCDGSPGRGYITTGGDCDDTDADNFPGNTEQCDGRDNDCDNVPDNGITYTPYYFDDDGDGIGDSTTETDTCDGAPGLGWVTTSGDCDDNDSSNYPGNTEQCDGQDNDCDNVPDNGITYTPYYFDDDGDGVGDSTTVTDTCDGAPGLGWVTTGGDCNDNDVNNFPGNPEVCDGQDNDCSFAADDGLTFQTWHQDNDRDTYGNSATATRTCDGAPGAYWVLDATDCDDSSAARYPGNGEVCDGLDNDCNNVADDTLTFRDYYPDADTDGYGSQAAVALSACAQPANYVLDNTDCDDGLTGVNPGARESTCNGLDDDCNSGTTDTPDIDADGVGLCAGDCDDNDRYNYPGNAEICDGQDNDCGATSIDAQCPTGLGQSGNYRGTQFGGGGGVAFDDSCGAGQVLIGINGRQGSRIDQIQGICGTLNLITNTSGRPYGYSITRTGSTSLPAHGGGGGSAFSYTCPTNQVVSQVFGRNGSEIDAVGVSCVSLSVSGSPGNYSVSRVAGSSSSQFGGGGGTAFSYTCSNNDVAKGLIGRTGSRVDAVGIRCTTITINQ